ncbi:MAG TPA: S1 RNA-binding domain-containing protein, partial [Candidatus Sulfotelmatobacter sp.]|nr:S1 RNA-binding domain-containing protein [Candidatus Sulfotelmatobacter sp.]
LIKALGVGPDGLPAGSTAAAFEAIGDHISATERRAAQAEREVVDRYTAAFLAAKIGAHFASRISGVTRFGLFVKLSETRADGLVPVRSLPADYYHHDERAHRLVGKRTRRVFTLGDPVEVRLAEADVVTGGLILALVPDAAAARGRRHEAAEETTPRAPRHADTRRGRRRRESRHSATEC